MIVALAASAALWLALLAAAPLLPVPLAAALYALGSHICHQRPERSFHLFAAQLPVCARCAGIYAGVVAGSVFAVPARMRARLEVLSPRTLLLWSALPTAVTVGSEWIGASAWSNAARAAAGLPVGAAMALVVAQSLATLHYGGCALRRPIASNRSSTPI